MANLKLHTPEGFSDVNTLECSRKRELERGILSVMKSYGFREVETPLVEYYDVFADSSGLINEETMFKFFDRSGKILALRPDITTPIARMVATKCQDTSHPIKLCYLGNAFRYDEVYQGVLQRGFTQAGVELVGENSPLADSEVIAVTIESILSAGITDFQIDIGQVAFFKGIMGQCGITGENLEKISLLIDRKDSLSIEELLEGLAVPDELKQIIVQLPACFGGIEIIDSIDGNCLCDDAKNALENLKQVYKTLCSYGYEKYIVRLR